MQPQLGYSPQKTAASLNSSVLSYRWQRTLRTSIPDVSLLSLSRRRRRKLIARRWLAFMVGRSETNSVAIPYTH